jgi:hypothetical protein
MTTIERKKTYTLSRKSEHSDSTNLEDLMQENEPNLSFWEQVWAMEGWISFWVWLVGGACIIASPAAIIWISNPEKYKLNLLLTESAESLRDPLKQVVRFSVWLTFSWSAFICIRFYLLVLPGILIRFITTTYGELSERAKVRLEYIPAVRVWLTGALWMVASVLIYRVVFFQMTIVNEWHGNQF